MRNGIHDIISHEDATTIQEEMEHKYTGNGFPFRATLSNDFDYFITLDVTAVAPARDWKPQSPTDIPPSSPMLREGYPVLSGEHPDGTTFRLVHHKLNSGDNVNESGLVPVMKAGEPTTPTGFFVVRNDGENAVHAISTFLGGHWAYWCVTVSFGHTSLGVLRRSVTVVNDYTQNIFRTGLNNALFSLTNKASVELRRKVAASPFTNLKLTIGNR